MEEKYILVILGTVFLLGLTAVLPSSYAGVPDELCFDIDFNVVPCDSSECVGAEVGECRTPDDDGDEIPNEDDNCPLVPNPNQEDTDGNGIGDACQDVDGDEILDIDDNCPLVSNSNQEDTDGNGIGDACQDVDGDKILDIDDNCPFISNPSQDDSNENGIGDACEEQIELLVNATFPAGDKVSVDLPPDPETGSFSTSLKLPPTNGGNVIVRTTDAGASPPNFSFLGFVIDFEAPCTDGCEITFTFTQAALDAQGITLDQVTIFHDMNGNGSFESDEGIPTTITGSDPYTATASASFTSKFSVGGIKALALGALAGGTGGSRGGSAPSLENLAFDGVRSESEDGTIGFGGLIFDEISKFNDFPTQTFVTGMHSELIFPFSEDNGAKALQHVAVYILNDGANTIYDSELYIVYDQFKPLKLVDSGGYISDYSVDVKEKSSSDVDIIFGITFELPIPPSDVIVRAWDNFKRSSDYRFTELIQVVESDLNQTMTTQEFTDVSSTNSTQDNATIQTGSNIPDVLSETDENTTLKIPLWIKFNANWWSLDEIGDDEFIAGIQYLIENKIIQIPEISQSGNNVVSEIPFWVKNSAQWWANDLTSDIEFVNTIQWLIEEGVIKI